MTAMICSHVLFDRVQRHRSAPTFRRCIVSFVPMSSRHLCNLVQHFFSLEASLEE
jgi:hypothetical protein